MISLKLRRPCHQSVVQKTGYLAGTREGGAGLKLRILPIHHLFAKDGPGIDMDWKNDEDLEGMEAPERGVRGISRGYKGRELNKATASHLHISEDGYEFGRQQALTRPNNRACQTDSWRHRREGTDGSKTSRQDALLSS
jgi:hypothetical protein